MAALEDLNVLSTVEGHRLFCNLLETQMLRPERGTLPPPIPPAPRTDGAARIWAGSCLTLVVATTGWIPPTPAFTQS